MSQPTISPEALAAMYLCAHDPTGTVAWPAPESYFPGGPGYSVYSCPNARCIERCSDYVQRRTDNPGTYRPFPPDTTG